MCQSEVTDILVIFCSIIIFCTAGGVGEGVLFELDTCSNVFLLLLGMMGGGGVRVALIRRAWDQILRPRYEGGNFLDSTFPKFIVDVRSARVVESFEFFTQFRWITR